MAETSRTVDPARVAVQETTPPRTVRWLYILVSFLYWGALNLYVPTLPTYVASKTDDLVLVGTVLSMYGLWQAIIRLPVGIAADWLGWRKPFILLGLALTGLGAAVMGLSHEVNGLLIGRAITGLAAGTWVPLVAVFSALYPPKEAVRASTLLMLFGALGRMLSTSVTGSLNQLGGYPLAFFLAAGVALVALLLTLAVREERRPPRAPSLRAIGRLAVRRDVLLPTLLNTAGQYANWAITFGFLPILARELGASDVLLSVMVTLNLLIGVLGNLTATGIVHRIGTRRLVFLSFMALTVGIAGMALAPSLEALLVAQVFLGLGLGAGYPVTMGMSIEHVADAERTTAMGLHQAIYAIGMFGGPALSGVLAQAFGLRPMFAFTAALCLVVGLVGDHWLAKPSATPLDTRPTAQ